MKSEIWKSLWKSYKNVDSVSIMNEPGGMLLRSEFIGYLLKYLDLKGKSILDVGTGTGQYCIELAMRGAKCTGIDIDSESIKLAKRIADDYEVDCEFKQMDLFDVRTKFDIVISMGTLEHYDDKEIVKMLKKMSQLGDYVIVGVPYSGSQIYLLSKAYAEKNNTWEYGFERSFYTLFSLMKQAGLKTYEEEIIGIGSEAFCLKRIKPELVSVQLAQSLQNLYKDKATVGNWLINIGITNKGLSFRDPASSPGVSIIIPVYNGEKYLKRSIENVGWTDYPNLEIIYVDDCSTDKSRQIIEDSPHSGIFLARNMGVSVARFKGMLVSKYNFIFFLDIDDLIFPYCIEKLMRDCVDDTYLSVSCALMNEVKFTGDIWYHQLLKSPKEYLLSELSGLCGKISLGNTIIRKDKLFRAYKILNELLEKVDIECMKIAEDSLLLDIMILNEDITRIIPVYYTYRGYEYEGKSASTVVEDRIKDIPLQMAYCLKVCETEKEREKVLKSMHRSVIGIYGLEFGATFMNNLKRYEKLIS